MLDKLPIELIVFIYSHLQFINFESLLIHLAISKKFLKIKNYIQKLQVKSFIVSCEKNKQMLFKFKPYIKNLRLYQHLSKDIHLTNMNLKEINYKALFISDVDFSFCKINDLTNIDFKISEKCKKICFCDCKNYSMSLITSLSILKNCESIIFYGRIFYGINNCETIILKTINALQKLQKIHLIHWVLNEECLRLLSNHKIIKLNQVFITGDLNLIQNYSKICLFTCWVGNYFNQVNKTLKQ